MRILVTAPIISRFEPELRSLDHGYEWQMASNWHEDAVLAALPETDVFVCTAMSSAMAAAAANLKLVQVAAAGYDRIPLHELPESVPVANTRHHGRAIAEHVIMVALMLGQRVIAADRELRSGVWRNLVNDATVPFHAALVGQTVGLLGIGEIGTELTKLAKAIGLHVQAVRQNPNASLPADVELDWVGGIRELPRLLSSSDILVIGIPLNEMTRGLIDTPALRMMKPTSILVNVARGAIVNEKALYYALKNGTIAGAGIDVWWANPDAPSHPAPSKYPFAQLDNVVLTPHASGHSRETFANRALDVAGNIDNVANGRPLINLVPRG